MVDDFIKLLDAIKAHGIIPAALAILILIILTFGGIYAARKTTTKPVAEGQAPAPPKKGLIATIVYNWEQRQLVKAREIMSKQGEGPLRTEDQQIVDLMAFKDLLVRNQMLEFMSSTTWGENGQPSRIFTFYYHNGGHYVSGDFMSKMSLHVQVQNKSSFLGQLEGDDVVRGLLRIDYPVLYEKLLRQGRFYISNVQSLRYEDPRLYSLLTRSNINQAYITEIPGVGKNPYGFLLVGYNETPPDEIYATQKIEVFANQLASTINLSIVKLNEMFNEALINKGKPVDKN